MPTKVNLLHSANNLTDIWKFLQVRQLNDHVLYLVKGQDRTLDFHTHDADEMFYVLDRKMQIEFEDRITDLSSGEFLIVLKGMRHRPVIKSLGTVLLIEKKGALTKERSGGIYPK
jgi:mannose-6-phosphate isomerase-like protein (cupin superfamily)